MKSLPVRERGLKFPHSEFQVPFLRVAPRAGAWIEIVILLCPSPFFESLPVRERGLKLSEDLPIKQTIIVAPRAGAWIEIPLSLC